MRIPAMTASFAIALAATPALATNPPPPPNDGAGAMVATMSTAEHLTGHVKRIYPTSDGTVHFRLSGTCKAMTYFTFSTNSQAGKNWYAMLLSAAAAGRPVRISMGSACSDIENQAVWYVYQDV